jgi:flagellar biosynthesis regulator FlaF
MNAEGALAQKSVQRDVVVTGNRQPDDVSWARAKALMSLESAVRERRLLLVHPQSEEQRMSSADLKRPDSVVQGFVFDYSVNGSACFVNPVLSWHIFGGDQEIDHGYYNIGLRPSQRSYAIVGFSFSPLGDKNSENQKPSIFVYVDMLVRNGKGLYSDTTGAISELYKMESDDQRVRLARQRSAKYICLSGAEQVDRDIRARIDATIDKNIVWTKFLTDAEYGELDKIYSNENALVEEINRSVLKITNRDPYAYGTLVLANYNGRPGGFAANDNDPSRKWIGCLPTQAGGVAGRLLDCNSGRSWEVFDPFGILGSIKKGIRKVGSAKNKYKGEVFPVTSLPLATISSKPTGADVYIDEEYQASPTNDDYTLPDASVPGVRIEKEGYVPCSGAALKRRLVRERPKIYKIDCRLQLVSSAGKGKGKGKRGRR